MADKEVPLKIVLSTVDKATAGIRALNKRLEAELKPRRDLGKAFGELRENLNEKFGFSRVVDGFKGVSSAISDLLGKVAMIGGVAGVAVAELVHIVGEFDDLGDKAERLGVGVDFLAQMQFAAERSGASVEALDSGIQAFVTNVGAARAGTGRMVEFLQKVSPVLLTQLKATKSNEAAILLMADAFAKVKDPAKRAALAAKSGFGAELAPLLAKGSKGVAELMNRFRAFAGSQEDAAKGAGDVDDSFKDLGASTQGIKAALVSGLAPAMKIVVDRLTQWFVDHRDDVKRWATDIGEKIPAAIEKVVSWVSKAVDKVTKFVDGVGGLKTVAIAAGAVLVGPLVSAFATLGAAMLATPAGVVVAGFAAIAAMAVSVGIEIDKLRDALDTKNEIALQDLAEMTPEQFHKAHPEIKPGGAKFPDLPPDPRGMMGAMGPVRAIPELLPPTGPLTPEARLSVEFVNAPVGMRAKVDPSSTVRDIDFSVGHQMHGALP